MAEVESRETVENGQVDLRDRVHDVRLEVEKVHTEVQGVRVDVERLRSEVTDLVRTEVQSVRSDMEREFRSVRTEVQSVRVGVEREFRNVRGEMVEMEKRLSDRIGTEISGLRAEMTDHYKSLRGWLALGMSVMTVLVALVAVLG